MENQCHDNWVNLYFCFFRGTDAPNGGTISELSAVLTGGVDYGVLVTANFNKGQEFGFVCNDDEDNDKSNDFQGPPTIVELWNSPDLITFRNVGSF